MMAKKSSKKYLIPLIVGICVGAVGLIMLISGLAIDVPPMGQDGWFESDSTRTFLCMFGGFIMVASLMVGLPLFFSLKSETPEARAKMLAKQKRNHEIFEEELKKYNIDPESLKKTQKKKVCAYCGGELEDGEKYCTSCGAKSTTKK